MIHDSHLSALTSEMRSISTDNKGQGNCALHYEKNEFESLLKDETIMSCMQTNMYELLSRDRTENIAKKMTVEIML